MSARSAMIIALALAAGAVLAQQPRDANPTGSGTASISGVVLLDGDSQRPAPRVRVTLTELTHSVPGQTTTTDDRGLFAFRGLPAGRFELFTGFLVRAASG